MISGKFRKREDFTLSSKTELGFGFGDAVFLGWRTDLCSETLLSDQHIVNFNNDLVRLSATWGYELSVVSVDETKGNVYGSGISEYNSTRQIIAIPNTGYDFTKWSDENTDNPRDVIVTSKSTLSAFFGNIQYTITTSSAGSGTVTGGGTYDYGSTATLSATPDENYSFQKWNDDNMDNPRNVTVTEDKTYVASFTRNTVTATFDSNYPT